MIPSQDEIQVRKPSSAEINQGHGAGDLHLTSICREDDLLRIISLEPFLLKNRVYQYCSQVASACEVPCSCLTLISQHSCGGGEVISFISKDGGT